MPTSTSNLPLQRDLFGGGLTVITGGGAGLGAALGRHAALELGMTVLLVDIDPTALETTRKQIEQAGGRALTEVVDVRDPDAVEGLAARATARHGPVRLLINNAGIEQFSLLWDTPIANWNRLVDININGVFYGIHAFVPRMIEQHEPAWVWNTSSPGGLTAAPFQGGYTMSKHAVNVITEVLRQEIAHVGAEHVHTSVILPWGMSTTIFETAGGAERNTDEAAQFKNVSEQGRPDVQTPDEAAKIIFAQGAAGEFYIVADERILDMMRERAENLRNRQPTPAVPA
jgi:NADP-dependent 3-hydroxy acid dehydrogenase YdfG